jgi:hypothetical protein
MWGAINNSTYQVVLASYKPKVTLIFDSDQVEISAKLPSIWSEFFVVFLSSFKKFCCNN